MSAAFLTLAGRGAEGKGGTKTRVARGPQGEGSLRRSLSGAGQGLSGSLAQGRGVVNAGVSENCSAICRGGKGHD